MLKPPTFPAYESESFETIRVQMLAIQYHGIKNIDEMYEKIFHGLRIIIKNKIPPPKIDMCSRQLTVVTCKLFFAFVGDD